MGLTMFFVILKSGNSRTAGMDCSIRRSCSVPAVNNWEELREWGAGRERVYGNSVLSAQFVNLKQL